MRLGVSLAATTTPTFVFSQRLSGFIYSYWNPVEPHGTLGFTVSVGPQLFLLVYLQVNVVLPSPQAAASHSLTAATLL